jgi:PAS domain S-box-containing protein
MTVSNSLPHTDGELEEQFRVLQLIHEMTTAVSQAEAVEDIYTKAISALMEILGADRAAILIRHDENGLQFEATRGLSKTYQKAVEGHSPWEPDDPHPQPIFIGNVREYSELGGYKETILAEGIGALAFIPLLYQGQLLGKFMIYYDQPHNFSDEEQQLAVTIAGHVALALSRKQYEKQLQEAREELEQRVERRTLQLKERETMLVESQRLAQIGSWQWDIANDRLLWSEELYHIFGQDPGEFTLSLERMAELIHADDVDLWLSQVRKEEKTFEGNLRILRPDGEQRILHSRTTPIFDTDGKRVKMLGTIQDVTERHLTEEALRQSERSLAEAQRVANLGSWMWDVASDQIVWSDEMYRIYGLDPDEFVPTFENYLELQHPDDREELAAVVQRSRETQTPFDHFHRIIRADGFVRILHARGRPVVDESGAIVRMYGTGQDVTEAKQTEEALRKSEESYRTLARNTPDAVIALYNLDLELIILEGNVADYITPGTSLISLLPPEEQENDFLEPFRQALEGTPQTLEKQYGERTYLIQAVPVRDSNGEIFAGMAMAQNITERKRTERKLEQRAKQLAALHEMGQTVASSLDLQVIFERVLDNLRPLLDAEDVFILLLEGKEELVFAAANEVGVGNLTGQRVPSTRGVASEVLRTGEVQWIYGEQTRRRVYHELETVAQYHPRAILAAPLNLHGEIIGVMEAVHTRSDAFVEEDKALIQTAANWTAIAIGNARQHGRLQRRLRESEALASISQALSETLDLEQVLHLIVDSAQELLPSVDWAAIHFLHRDRDHEELYPVALAGLDAEGKQLLINPEGHESVVDPLPEGLLGDTHSLDLDQPIMRFHGTDSDAEQSTSLLVVPIQSREGRLGTLSVQSAVPEAYSEEDKKLLSTLGRQAAIAIEHARLFKVQQEARQTAESLRAANATLSQTLDLNIVLKTLFDYADELVGFNQAVVLLIQRGLRLRVRAWRGLQQSDFNSMFLDARDYPSMQQAIEGKHIVSQRIAAADFPWLQTSREASTPVAMMALPLLTGDRVVGLFAMFHDNVEHFTNRHETLAEVLVAQASVAVQNARLFAQVQSSQERLRQLSKQVVSAQEEERQRISRELHDEAGQALTALKISLEMIKGSWQDIPDLISGQMDEAISMTDQTMEHIRLLAHDLRPPVLDTFGLEASVEGLVRDFGRRAQLEIEFEGTPIPELPEAVTMSCYRFVQEALTNVAKYAKADKVRVELRNDGDKIMVAVTDNGIGFDVDEQVGHGERNGGIGLVGMQDRFELLNGWVDIDSAIGRGTRVAAVVPYREEE